MTYDLNVTGFASEKRGIMLFFLKGKNRELEETVNEISAIVRVPSFLVVLKFTIVHGAN